MEGLRPKGRRGGIASFDFSDISELGDVGPSELEHFPRIRFDFDLEDDFHARLGEAEVSQSDA